MGDGKEHEEDSLGKLLFDFGLGTTSHGIPRIFGAKSLISRLIWILLVTAAFVVFCWQAALLIIQYLSFDVTTIVTVDNINGLAQDFPAVTICNTNRAMKSKITQSDQYKLAEIDTLTSLRYYAPCYHGDKKCKKGNVCYKPFRQCNGINDCDGGDDELNCNYAPCREDQFTCANGSPLGRCISLQNKCNRILDCYDGQDEECDAHEVECRENEFRCESGVKKPLQDLHMKLFGNIYCIPDSAVCDEKSVCVGDSDEFCECDAGKFPCYEFGKVNCIDRRYTCDGKPHCYDGRDETIPCKFTCNNGDIIAGYMRCDTRVHCKDKSDEIGCNWDIEKPCATSKTDAASVLEWRCDNGDCILNSSRCNRVRDCEDGSDEIDCGCGMPEYYVCDNGECVDRYARCNGIRDCFKGEDEKDCKSVIEQRVFQWKDTISWHPNWTLPYQKINKSPHVYKHFYDALYKDRGFQRVEGEYPPDWVGFMTFSSTPDNSDLADVLKLNKRATANFGHDGNKFIQQCTFRQRSCSASAFYPFQHDKYGNCYTFNSGKTFNLNKNFEEVTNESHAFYRGDGRILRTNRPGVQQGLKLTLFVQENEFIGIFGQDVGVKVVIHPQNIAPFPEDTAITASVGQLTSIAVKKRTINRQPEPYSNCTDDEEGVSGVAAQMFPEYGYSVQACLKSCVQENLKKYCKCVDTLLIDDTPRCQILDEEQERCQQLIFHFAQTNYLDCSCPPACSEIIYDKIVSQSSWPSNSYLKRLLHSIYEKQEENTQVVYDIQSVRDNLARLEIFFEDLSYVNVAEHPAYKIENLLGDIGGTLGLYIGLSLITICEFGEFVFYAFQLLIRRFKSHLHRNKVQVINND